MKENNKKRVNNYFTIYVDIDKTKEKNVEYPYKISNYEEVCKWVSKSLR